MLNGRTEKEDIKKLESNLVMAYEAIEHTLNHLDRENFIEDEIPVTRAEYEELKAQVEMLLNK